MKHFLFNGKINIVAENFVSALHLLLDYTPGILVTDLVVTNNQKTTVISPEIISKINTEIVLMSPRLHGFTNYGGFSCFIDAVLYPILITESCLNTALLIRKYPDECITKTQQALRDILQNGGTCKPVISALKECSQLAHLLSGEQQDDSEFLIQLMDLFKLEPTTVKTVRKVSNDARHWITTSENTTSETLLPVIIHNEGTNILDLFQTPVVQNWTAENIDDKPEYNDSRYDYTYEQKLIESSDCLIFHTNRKLTNQKNRSAVSWERYIRDTSTNKHYKLTIITVHLGSSLGGHYISYFIFNNQWYKYDDLMPKLQIIDYDTVVQEAKRDTSLLFYF